MSVWRHALIALIALALAACNEKEPTYQGWVEANLIFVAPDETGRVQTLSVREGDSVNQGAPLFILDDDLQLAELLIEKAGVAAVPGSAFGAPGHMRLSFATSMANLEKAVSRIAGVL